MEYTKAYRFVRSFALLVAACGLGCGEAEAPVKEMDPATQGSLVRDAASNGLELNNGRRWQVGPHMMAPVRRHQERLSSTSPQDLVTEGAAAALADSLFADIDELVQACDMKGKGHDVLHDWLMPHMSLLQRLERATQAESVSVVLVELQRSNHLFDRYFE